MREDLRTLPERRFDQSFSFKMGPELRLEGDLYITTLEWTTKKALENTLKKSILFKLCPNCSYF